MNNEQEFSFNWNEQERNHIIANNTAESRDFWRFKIKIDQLQQLVDKKFANPEDKQNNAPTLGCLLEIGQLAHDTGQEVEFVGYAISAKRGDYRITIDGINIWLEAKLSQELADKVLPLEETADEFIFDSDCITAWWD